MDDPVEINQFASLFEKYQDEITSEMTQQGFWEVTKNPSIALKFTKILLIISELVELSEGIRNNVGKSDHIEGFLNEEEELADAIIRIMDYAGYYGLDIVGAFLAKIKYNRTREYKHGKLV